MTPVPAPSTTVQTLPPRQPVSANRDMSYKDALYNKDALYKEGQDFDADDLKSDISSKTKISDSSSLDKKDKDKEADQSSTTFSELIASLFNIQPVQIQPTAKNISVSSGSTDISVISGEAPAADGTTPVLSIPSLTIAQPQNKEGFSKELLSALTQGTPAPTEITPALMAGIPISNVQPEPLAKVAIPVLPPQTEAAPTPTPALTVSSFVNADPRLCAAPVDPSSMQVVKEAMKNIGASTPQSLLQNSAPASTTPPIIAKTPPSVTVPQTAPIQASVNSTPDAPPVIVVQLSPAPAKPVQQKSAIQENNSTISPVASPSQAQEGDKTIEVVSSPAPSTPPNSPVLKGNEPENNKTEIETTSFDLAELSVAQKSSKPMTNTPARATPNATPPIAPQAAPQALNTRPVSSPANSNVAVHVESGMMTKTDIGSNSGGSSFDASITTTAMPVTDTSLTTSPLSLPATSLSSPLTSPIVQNVSATLPHAAIQTVANLVSKNAKQEGSQTISLRLDPPELGKLQVQMKYKKGEPLRVHVVLEKSDTAAMFQRDSGVLESALKDAGLQTDSSSLSFEFSQNGSEFQQTLGQDNSSGKSAPAISTISASNGPASDMETSMDIYTDARTGLTRYNIKV